ncbi:MAG: AI-2E family transporter [Candidatus Moraniibacteriota bacterium]|nr:MAG: AI-2E family transporter [Candidatus Moranbacteria bacterium]
MRIPNLNTIFFFSLFFAIGVVVFFVLKPFLTPVLVAAVLATLFFPQYRFLVRLLRGSSGWAAAGILFLVAFLVIIPLLFILVLVVGEATQVLATLSSGNHSLSGLAKDAETWFFRLPYVGEYLRAQDIRIETMLGNVSGSGGAFLSFLQALYGGAASFVFWMFSLFFALFYFLIDGERALKFLKRLSPLADDEDEELMRDFVSMSRAIIKGSLVVSLVQGTLGGVGFAIAGLPSPALWGAVMGVFSLIPMVGTGIVWFPSAVWLLFMGNIWQGIFLLVFGMGIISTVDNILRPRLVGRDTQIHPLLVFFSTMGGISFFGIAGFLIGPIIVSFFLALVRIYGREFKRDLEQLNEGNSVPALHSSRK